MRNTLRAGVLCLLAMLPASWGMAQGTATAEQKEWIVQRATSNLNKIKPDAVPWQVFSRIIAMLQPLDLNSRAEVIQKLWPELKVGVARTNLLTNFVNMGTSSGEPCNPRLLDILHLAATDSDPLVRQSAYPLLTGIAFKVIEKPEAYTLWREAATGKSIEQMLRENAAAVARSLREGTPEQRAETLRLLSSLGLDQQQNGWSIVNGEKQPTLVGGLTGLRLRMLREAGLLESLLFCMRPDIPTVTALRAASMLNALEPNAAFLKQIEPDLRRLVEGGLNAGEDIPVGTIALLTRYSEEWTAESVSRFVLKAADKQEQKWQLIGMLRFYREPRMIPTLIALMEKYSNDWEMRQVQEILEELSLTSPEAAAGVPSQMVDADWWRDWWEDNRSTFPKSLQVLDIPGESKRKKLLGRVNEDGSYSYPAVVRKMRLDNDINRQFYLVSSGTLIPPGKEKFTDDNVLTALPRESRARLVVVLCDTKRDLNQARYGWQQVCQAQGGKLVVALVVPPGGKWTTRREDATGPTAAESLTGGIVRYLQAMMPLDTSRIYLYGEGTGGMAAYACSLDPLTLFTGFSVFASAFRSAQLPSLSTAKGRRYFLQHDPQDTAAPIFLAKSAQIALQRAGASVKLVESKMADPANRASTQEQITASLQWLEASSPPKQ